MYCDHCFSFFLRYFVPGMYQVFDGALFSPCLSRLLLSVRVLILKEHENLHVRFEDCVGRRVETAFQGRFWSLLQVQEALAMPSTLIYNI